MARHEGLVVDGIVSDCFSSSSCKENVLIAVEDYIKANDSAYFRARVATRTVVGVLTGAGLISTHCAIENAVLDGAMSAEALIPVVIYGHD
ncbi:hypothetical protein [Bacterioplanoides sp. SCSIO 12839]|uniref:hypothetical protein n=1 Tax=Bacterioplanoides sp. SCSIO 12839 TaxID=2829569 RepID=UPI00210751CD|nr:hypothetical protein [Bacterioplanoides sp. SCSIO 12839]UTW49577.1 hypothetical protein KFF03_06725 [Bacterioplanoides sp. SCSIO 12839]